eukprot:CAMPEP_0116024918 /NCGR_PEP_ID=MMETSP0321-20121206/12669_1 /TAXON_ID=163516 /ORGANISM="Leptocylindrus danicus var. danicus, Strain B650" /LENGTH=169 /DNA_ID=CAMNT_0003496873 /DNA_START=350 /DNA_END=860 /DNA_ORIENTATION=+
MRVSPNVPDIVSEAKLDNSSHSAVAVPLKQVESMNEARRKVSFGAVQFREHELVLGDNPSCSMGPPVSLGWGFKDRRPMNLDLFEQARSGTRRNDKEFYMPTCVREEMLFERDYSRAELREVVTEIGRIQHQRTETVKKLKFAPCEEVFEKARRKLRRVSKLLDDLPQG